MDAKGLSSAIARFSAKFINELPLDKSVVSSPLSAEYLLALLTLGCEEPAHSELLTALNIPDDHSIRSSFTSVATKLKDIKGVTLNVANKVYIKEGAYELVQQLRDDAVKVFDAGFEKMDFAKSVASAAAINKWVEDKTNNRIKDLLSSESLNNDTRLVLVNAIYFKGSWQKKFSASATRPRPFHVNLSTKVDIPMMYMEDNFKFGVSQELNAQLLEMPYVGNEASMLVILPNEIEGLNGVLKKLAAGHDLMTELDNMHSLKVQVTLPKFKIETTIDLTKVLPKLGIRAIFDQQRSGLTKILDNKEQLYVSTAIQKAFIEVNEEGAEAAAATGMVMTMRCAMMHSPAFLADRPFIYLIANQNRNIIFMGVYRVMGVAFCMAMISPPPVPRFVADRPFLVGILIGRTPYFFATHQGTEHLTPN